ncbi:bile acid:sodium symporter family protein [Modestobacter sp. I12A-02628]|uniref:Bile acid:sodium symporter family protein n=1 Tax=Goekera deserti TaxID=2497753 RepID=A0A7K3WLJ3_9ACTN|nr:bile acid:sodium symporter family protein [Goekera deserti]MPQ97046.1 bile acid:sodium symporter family protein [Goekera deserti]NDI46637.1 bile acid:sodium symporter family protein [Goekera deserti]NEL56393.1 bile acid:sodium symporter family protein [Goekera deserti]
MAETSPVVLVTLPLALALIMGSLGLSLTPADFRRVLTQPRGVLIGLGNLLVVSPLLAFGVATLYGLDAFFAVGLVLLGSTPGGTTANMLTHLARGDTALSVSMTALSSIAAVVTVPLYLGLAIDRFDAGLSADVSLVGTSAQVFAITVVPLAVGMLIRSRRTDWAVARQETARKVALVAFLVVVVVSVASEFGRVADDIADLALAVVTLNLLAMGVSFALARLGRLDGRQATAVALELGVHNSTVAIAVGSLIDPRLTIPAAVYSVFMFLTGGAFARLMSRRNAAAEGAVPAGQPGR